MAEQYDIGQAIKTVRTLRGLSQEAFSDVSSRTYLSTLERGLKNPTLSKLAELCEVMQIHPLTLMALAYVDDASQAKSLLSQVEGELGMVWRATNQAPLD
ncbi:helix-turn-helix domain-containing protein [Bordetella petrii]|uniref:Predicted transcriptional regulator n=1 Tax=Bordetella petrii (strain ATCC BAA-461 / DSM 12804 / CCUG 43448 / CIP 107267 / Se-1111R) TaxID=340100 RepID=A9IEV2_BORPD|nr:helix-turn-helix transcriptional regulator [Bordetella petrii]MBO1112131.1 helix-turn-helix transcriptional regulator [Bordetella petrii]MBO9353182.1 helix-turn-helix domain-containing protein [Bordetella petrii]CAP44911.1 predicted transcriptional regulator [Bordetella petrii]